MGFSRSRKIDHYCGDGSPAADFRAQSIFLYHRYFGGFFSANLILATPV